MSSDGCWDLSETVDVSETFTVELGSTPVARPLVWADLYAQYVRINQSLLALGGRWDTEREADALLAQQQGLIARLAAHRALSRQQIAQKLNAVVAMLDESDGSCAATLLQSAVEDLLR